MKSQHAYGNGIDITFFLLFKEMIKSPTILHLFLQTVDVLGGY